MNIWIDIGMALCVMAGLVIIVSEVRRLARMIEDERRVRVMEDRRAWEEERTDYTINKQL
jgi:uncharacterized membrane protein